MCIFRVVQCGLMTIVLSLSSPMAISQENVNINTDGVKRIAKFLEGVGDAKAMAIIKYREKNGQFKTIDDLSKVKGISKRLVKINRERIVVDGAKDDQ